MAGTGNSGGRNTRSRQTHVLAGTFRKDRHAGHETPEAPKGIPEPPKPLEGDALDEWNRMIDRLTQLGTLSKVDDAAIYNYCKVFARTESLEVLQIETAGSAQIMEENIGDLKGADLVQAFQEITKLRALEARYVSQERQGRMALRAWLVEFGLTPAARSRVKLPAAKPAADPVKDRYFSGTRRA